MALALAAETPIAYSVANSTSPALSRLNANYLADGTADQVEINAAITAASLAGGGEVLLLEGTYSITAPIVVKENVTLKALGKVVVAPVVGFESSAVTRDGVDICAAIRNETTQSHRTAVSVTDQNAVRSALTGSGMLIHNVGSTYVYLWDGDESSAVGNDKDDATLRVITGCQRLEPGATYFLPATETQYTVIAADGESSSIYEYTESNLSIEGIEIDYSAVTSDTVHHAGIWLDGCYNARVTNCHVQDVLYGVSGATYRQFGVLLIDAHSCTIDGGSYRRCGYEGIAFRGNCYSCIAGLSACGENGVHMAQVAGFFHTGSSTYGAGKSNTFQFLRGGSIAHQRRGAFGDGVDIIIHGDIADGTCADNRILNCDCGTITLTDSQQDSLVQGNTVYGHIKLSHGNSNVIQKGIRILANTIKGDETTTGGFFIDVSSSASDCELVDLEVAHNVARDDLGAAGSWYINIDGDNFTGKRWNVHHNTQEVSEYAWRIVIASGSTGSLVEHVCYDHNSLIFPVASGGRGGVRLEVATSSGTASAINHTRVRYNKCIDAANRQIFVRVDDGAQGTIDDVDISFNEFDDDNGSSAAAIVYFVGTGTNIRVNNNVYSGTAVTRVFGGPLVGAATVQHLNNTEITAPTAVDGTTGGTLTVQAGSYDFS